MGVAIELQGVSKRYRVYRERYRSLKEIVINRRLGEWEDRWALRDVDLRIDHGETVGLVGANGVGKSTTLKLMARILAPTRGRLRVDGRLSALIELGAGLQPEYTGRENIYLYASLLGLTRAEIDRRFDSIVGFAELEDHIEAPLRTYSSGMQMRLAFSVAINVDPEILLVDEILAVGDEAFQRKCYEWLEAFQRRGGTLVLVSHNLGAIRQMCSRSVWISGGRVQLVGDSHTVVNSYLDAVRERRLDPDLHPELEGLPAVQLDEVRLSAEELESGDPLAIDIGYRCNRRLETPVFGVSIYRNDGLQVYGSNTAVDGFEVPPIVEDGRITLTYRSLPLLSGTYLVTVAVFP